MEAGVFVLIQRGDQWDEMMLVVPMGSGEWLSLTDAAERLVWVVVKLRIGNFRVVTGRDTNREPPVGVIFGAVNWVVDPADTSLKWAPADAAALAQLVREGEAIVVAARPAFENFRAGLEEATIEEVGGPAGPVEAGQAAGGAVGLPTLPFAGAAAASDRTRGAAKKARVGEDLETLTRSVADLGALLAEGDPSRDKGDLERVLDIMTKRLKAAQEAQSRTEKLTPLPGSAGSGPAGPSSMT